MFATMLTLGFVAASLFAVAALAASLAKGLAAAAALAGDRAGGGEYRSITVRSAPTSGGLGGRPLTAPRAPRRTVRPVLVQARCPRRVAA